MEDKYKYGLALILIALIDGGVFYLGYYVTDKIDMNTSINHFKDTFIDGIKEEFMEENDEDWDLNGDKIFDEDSHLLELMEDSQVCYGLIMRLEFLPEEIRKEKSGILILFRELKFTKINDNARFLKKLNFIDGIVISGIAFISGISVLLIDICTCFKKCLYYFYIILFIILIIIAIVSLITKVIYQIKEWMSYNGSKITFVVKLIKRCEIKEIFEVYYGFIFNIKNWLVGCIFTELFSIFIQATGLLLIRVIDIANPKNY